MRNVAGVILAGGRSSRMGQNKALMLYQGQRLVDIVAGRLREVGVSDIMIGGEVKGYPCLPDKTPHEGPAHAILNMAEALQGYAGALFAPVDIPLVTSGLLRVLAEKKDGAFYEGHPLPVYIPVQKLSSAVAAKGLSVWKILEGMKIRPVPIKEEDEKFFLNVNTPEEYKKLSHL